MRDLKFSSLVIIAALTLASCKKDSLDRSECNSLGKALIAEDVKMVSNALRNELSLYSQENINKLSVAISNKCNITVSQACFNCIYTEPMQSELRVVVNQSGISIEKVIDISYTVTNKMRIVSLHD